MLASRRVFVVAVLFALANAGAWALTVDEVVQLSQASVSDDVIVSQIDASGSVFVLSADDLIRMKENSVSERVMLHMIRTRTAAASGDPAPLAGALQDRIQERDRREVYTRSREDQAPERIPVYQPAATSIAPVTTYVIEQPVQTPVYYTYVPSYPRYYYVPAYNYAPAYAYYPSSSCYPSPSYGFSYFSGGHGHRGRHHGSHFGFGLSFGFH